MSNSVKITDFKPDPNNANKGTERGLRLLDDSLAQVGLGRSIVVDKNGYIIAGNKTQERAVDQGFDDVEVVKTRGDKLVVVQREDLDLLDNDPNNPARKLAYLDNRVSELDLQWDVEQVLADVQADMDLGTFFYAYELDQLASIGSIAEINPDDEWLNMPEFEQDAQKPYQSINLHFNSEEAVQAFARLISQTITDKTKFLWYPKRERANLKAQGYET